MLCGFNPDDVCKLLILSDLAKIAPLLQ